MFGGGGARTRPQAGFTGDNSSNLRAKEDSVMMPLMFVLLLAVFASEMLNRFLPSPPPAQPGGGTGQCSTRGG
jgi:hypothetical protein